MYYIYELIDPCTGIAGYVGITNNPGLRLQQHLADTRCNQKKVAWIQQLVSNSIQPQMKILELASCRKLAHERERYWILSYLDRGVHLTNSQIFVPFQPGPPRNTQKNHILQVLRRLLTRNKLDTWIDNRFSSCDVVVFDGEVIAGEGLLDYYSSEAITIKSCSATTREIVLTFVSLLSLPVLLFQQRDQLIVWCSACYQRLGSLGVSTDTLHQDLAAIRETIELTLEIRADKACKLCGLQCKQL